MYQMKTLLTPGKSSVNEKAKLQVKVNAACKASSLWCLHKSWTAWIDRRGQGIRLTGALIRRSHCPCGCTHEQGNFSQCFQCGSNIKALQFLAIDGNPLVRIRRPLQRANVHMNLHGSKLCKPYTSKSLE